MKSNFELIKEKVPIENLIGAMANGELKQVGSDTFGLNPCPFCGHDDCFRVTPNKGLFQCFGCEKSGSVIDFVMHFKNCNQFEALKYLANQYNIEISQPEPGRKNIFETATEIFHQNLLGDRDAYDHQTRVRGHSKASLAYFKVGYSNGKLYSALKKNDFADDEILESGLVKKNETGQGYRDFFFPDLFIYPHKNLNGCIEHFSCKPGPKSKPNAASYQLKIKEPCLSNKFFNSEAFNTGDVILVEGQNDTISIFDAGFKNAVACIGNISADQISMIRKYIDSGKLKSISLCFDNDEKGTSYTNLLVKEISRYCYIDHRVFSNNIRLNLFKIEFDSKDIDQFLRGKNKPESFEMVFNYREPVFKSLSGQLEEYRVSKTDEKGRCNPNLNEIGEVVFSYFNKVGKCYYDTVIDACFLYFRNCLYRVGNNVAFNSVMYLEAGVNCGNNGSSAIITVLNSLIYRNCQHIQGINWIHTDLSIPVIYMNLNTEKHDILKLSPGKVELLKNGTNPDHVLLKPSPIMRQINYLPEVEISESMELIKTKFMPYLTCAEYDRFFILAHTLNIPLIQTINNRGITKYSGNQASAKSAAAKYETALIYGQDFVTTSSAASNYTEGAKSPLIVEDNLENKNLNPEKINFLLLAATGAVNKKRKGGTDDQNTYERLCTQVIVTAIEPFSKDELISRT